MILAFGKVLFIRYGQHIQRCTPSAEPQLQISNTVMTRHTKVVAGHYEMGKTPLRLNDFSLLLRNPRQERGSIGASDTYEGKPPFDLLGGPNGKAEGIGFMAQY